MDNGGNQKKRFNLEEFSKKSEEFYKEIKLKLESESKGKYVALDFESKRHWVGNTATEALSKAREEFPNKLFYLVQVGSSAPFSIQSIKTRQHPNRRYVFAGSY